jgi:hypothetical protein
MTRLVTHGSPRAAWIARVTNTPNNTYLTSRSTPLPGRCSFVEPAQSGSYAFSRARHSGSVMAYTRESRHVPLTNR